MRSFHPMQIAAIRPDADDAVSVSLAPAQDLSAEVREQFRGEPGQHVVLRAYLDAEDLRRTYSLVSAPGEWPLRIVVRVQREGRMSRYLAEKLCVGELLEVMPPTGSLTPRLDCGARKTYVAFAAGCGITPVICIARAVLSAAVTNRFVLFYGNTRAARAMCLEDLLALKDCCMERLSLHFLMSREPQEAELYNGRIDAARVRRFAGVGFEPRAVAEFFVCGPGRMNEEVVAVLRELGVEPHRVHAERFHVEETQPAVEPEVKGALTGLAAVTLTMDGRRRSFTMRLNEQTVLEGAARAGVELPFSCRAGVCSTCRTKVLRGEVIMEHNYALEEGELREGYVLACQARVITRELELDYDEK